MATVGISLAVPPGNGTGAPSAVTNMNAAKTVIVGGTFSANVIIEANVKPGGEFCQVASFSRPGQKVVAVVANEMRVRIQGFASGAPDVDVSAEEAVVQSVSLPAPAGNGVGASVAIDQLGELTTALAGGTYTGQVLIEVSEDDVDYAQGFSTLTGTDCDTKVIPANFARVRRVGVNAAAPGLPDVGLAAVVGGGGGGVAVSAPRTDFVFRPGDPLGARQNVYTDWAAMFAAIATVQGTKRVLLDDEFVTPIAVPVGSWDVTDVEFVGIGPGVVVGLGTVMSFPTGAVLTSSKPIGFPPGLTLQRFRFRNVVLDTSAAGPPITLTGATAVGLIELVDSAIGGTPGGLSGPVVATVAPLAGGAAINMQGACRISDPTTAAVDVGAGTTLAISAYDQAIIDDNFTGTGSLSILVRSDAVQVSPLAFAGAYSLAPESFSRWEPVSGFVVTATFGRVHRIQTGGGPIAVPLPPSDESTKGQQVCVKKATAEAVNALSVTPSGADTVEGATSTTTAFGTLVLVDNGDGTWSTIGLI